METSARPAESGGTQARPVRPGRAVLVCLAKDEDRYMDEWLDYHFKLGFCEAHVYQNDWQYRGALTGDGRVKLHDVHGRDKQKRTYNDFLHGFAGGDIDFAAFFDGDEFMCLKPGLRLDGFLANFSDCLGVALNWKFFGDSGLAAPVGGDYSVVRRFTRCQRGFSKTVKTIVNLRRCGAARFTCDPHSLGVSYRMDCVKSANGSAYVRGASTREAPLEGTQAAWLNHYFCKTRAEFEDKIRRGRVEWSPRDGRQRGYYNQRWRWSNRNESEDFTARDFYLGTDAASGR